MSLYNQIQETLQYIRSKTNSEPHIGIVLGTGLGSLVEDIVIETRIPYSDLPHFPETTVQSHDGYLIFGTIEGQKVVAMAGRFHYYEGYSTKQITFPIRVMKALGVSLVVLSNAVGGTNQHLLAGDLVFIRDHIYLQPENPLRGINDERLGPRFPDQMSIYNKSLNEKALTIANKQGIRSHIGVYLCLQGPNLETPAEYRFFNTIGADVVGMSTIPEVIVANHAGIGVFVVSVVTNKAFPLEEIRPCTVEEVIAVAQEAAPKMRFVVKKLLSTL